MRLLTLSSVLLSTVASILAAPVPISVGEDSSISVHLLRRTGDKIYRGGVQAIVPKEGELKQDAHGNYIPGGSGISVTANPAMLPHKQAREMTKADAAQKFELTHTPTKKDPDHHSLDLKSGQRMTPKQLETHLNTGWTPTPAHERANHLAAAKQAQNSGQAHGGSHQSPSSSQNQAAHAPSNSQQHHAAPAPAAPKTGGTTRSWAQVVAGNKPATQQHTGPASKQGGGSHSGSQAASQGHTTPHQSPASHAGTPPPASHPGTSHSTSQSHSAPHQAPPAAHQSTSHSTPGSPPARSWAQVVAAPPAHKAATPNTQAKKQGKKP